MPRTAVIILCFNHREDTLACLASLFADPDPELDVLVVDNASVDDTVAAVADGFPRARILRLPENRGWAGGNNAGMRDAMERGAELLCLLNNDTLVPPGTIRRLAETARAHGPCLLHPAIDYADPAAGAQLDPAAGIVAGEPVPGAPGLFRIPEAYGACLMIPAAVVRRLGGFDERFFLQLEETDLWLRANGLGVSALCDTTVRIVHAESVSFGGRVTPAKTYYSVRNQLLLTEKHRRSLAGVLGALRSIWWTASRLGTAAGSAGGTGATLRWLFSDQPQAGALRWGVADYLLRRFGRGRGAALMPPPRGS